jgi:hypothetical protein
MRSCAEDNIPQDQRRLLKKRYHARSLSQYLRMNDENTAQLSKLLRKFFWRSSSSPMYQRGQVSWLLSC